jgi:hypothetical protein
MQAKEIQHTLESKGVPTEKAVPAAEILAKELKDTKLVRTSQEQATITAAWECLSNNKTRT